MMMKVSLKKTAGNPKPFSVHVDLQRDPIARTACKADAFDAVNDHQSNEQVVHTYTVVDNRKMAIAWTGVVAH